MKWALFGGECSPCNTVHHGKKYTNLACFESRFCSRAAALEFSIYTNNRSVSRNCFDALQKHCSVVGKITSPLTYMLVILLHNLCCFRSYCFCRSRPGCLTARGSRTEQNITGHSTSAFSRMLAWLALCYTCKGKSYSGSLADN